ncbi:3-hydroxyisobutyrate dehydrogenase [Hoyosella rhizosphaerae]|uniref:3-hydroxyisobutyrate dehydrogenase n=1 Tax=Hoyosella rhizosphaerae TaxID=1755582 RepID=A0A916U1H2_9ACTN|nr:3-hydroxyisobutyrate dehydrogenase [Hoyosella rhizosphaerae]MBN4926688.1 3-hydroxyisobutyrate dehydrogenase [Hoyosella rhizosphaerae]GGC57184.1 3-hydroxyisobutyrate dehydrogenase [Hoyosella rhizosphaerae]
MPTIAFIGLGHMGGPMAHNLVTAGYPVQGYDVVPAALALAAENGITTVGSLDKAVADATVVITMLPSGAHVHQVYDTVLATATPNTLFLDCSTIDVDDARTAHDKAVKAGHRFVDAPVSGGVAGATAGTLTMMVGGSADDVNQVRPLLDIMGRNIVHCGAAGAGQAAKICNNMILGISMIAVSEAFVLGEKLGLTHDTVFKVASQASGQCWALTSYCPVPGPVPTSPANNDYQPGFAVELMDKDLGLAANALAKSGVTGELGQHASQIYHRVAKEGGHGLDFSAIINDIRRRSEQPAD